MDTADREESREYEQQHFMQALFGEINKSAGLRGRDYYDFAMEISLLILQFLRYGQELFGPQGGSTTEADAVVMEHFVLAREKITGFARTETEVPYLFEMLLRQFLMPVSSFCKWPYIREGAENPQKVYGAEE